MRRAQAWARGRARSPRRTARRAVQQAAPKGLLLPQVATPAPDCCCMLRMQEGKRRSGRVRGSIGLLMLYVLIGVAGALTISRVFVGNFPWEPASNLQVINVRTFDGLLAVTFGFLLTIGVVMLLANLVGRGITCPRWPWDGTSAWRSSSWRLGRRRKGRRWPGSAARWVESLGGPLPMTRSSMTANCCSRALGPRWPGVRAAQSDGFRSGRPGRDPSTGRRRSAASRLGAREEWCRGHCRDVRWPTRACQCLAVRPVAARLRERTDGRQHVTGGCAGT